MTRLQEAVLSSEYSPSPVGGALRWSGQVTVRVVASDDNSGIGEVHLSHNPGFEPFSGYPPTGDTTEIPWTLPESGEVHVRVIDRAGNRSEASSVKGSISVYLPLVLRNQ